MRISDWSSDVCSSDLIDDEHRPLVPLAHKLNDGACRTGLTPAGWDLEHGLALTRGDRFAEKVDGLLLVRPKLDLVRPPRFTSNRVRSSRSEKHRSELQSQMPTLYAVFCLKKKIQHTEDTQLSMI